jgi:hypothetical protein
MSGTLTPTSNQPNVPAITASNTAGGPAGLFEGGLSVTGNLSVTGPLIGVSIIGISQSKVEPAIGGVNESGGTAVEGISAQGNGVHGMNGGSGTPPRFGSGVWGESEFGYGLYAASKSSNGVHSVSASSVNAAVYAESTGGGPALSGKSTGKAGEFHGDVSVSGNVTVTTTLEAAVIIAPLVQAVNLNVATSITTESMLVALNTETFNLTANGNLTVLGDIYLPGADCAEQFDIAAGETLVPGTVVVIDAQGALRKSMEAYDRKVAGVVSGAGLHKPAIILDRQASQEGRVPIALVGKVYCQVDAQYASIGVGDLLTTSPTPGHAMRAIDPGKAFGAVLGKALRPLIHGQGLIPVLVALQ